MPEELEWKTRKDRVDRKLISLHPAWAIVKYRPDLDTASLHCHAVQEYPTQSGPADYALFVKGRLLGIIEAKKVKVGPANVLEQAKRYARAASDGPGSWQGFRVPFLYATNGEVIHFLDVRNARNLSRRIEQFHTADALEEMFGRPAGFEWFQANPVAIEKLRPYQKKAIEAVEAALSAGRRAMLVAMATGTGKWSRSSIVDTKSIMLPGVVRGPAGKALGVWPPFADARYPAWILPISQILRLR